MRAAKSSHARLRMMGTTFEYPVHLAKAAMNYANKISENDRSCYRFGAADS